MGKLNLTSMSGKKMLLKYVPECWGTRLSKFQISNVSGGACPWTLLDGRVALQLTVLAMQAQFTSAAYSVQIRHPLHFLMTTL